MPIPFDPSLRADASPIAGDARASARTPEQLQVAALVQQFEGMLLTEMLRDLRINESDDESFGLGGATMADTMRGEFGLALSKAGGLGLGDMLADAFARQRGVRSVDETAPAPTGTAGMAIGKAIAAATSAVDAAAVTSGFGWRDDPFTGQARLHTGTDLRLAYGSPVAALAPGTVTFAGERGGYGTTLVIDHGNGRETLFAHLSSIDVRVGDTVEAGETIARSGNSGRSTGAHLHVEVREAGRPVDPRTADLDLPGRVENGPW
jgi:murein DD-endopeptidase MepM/ murein hydrolase activator NlpD